MPADKLMGCTEPRLFTPPLRELTRATSNGYSVADFAELVLGEPLMPWQRWLAIHAMELNPDGTYRFRTVVALCARQSGKTTLIKTLALWRLYIDGAALVMGSAQTRDVAKEAFKRAILSVESSPELRGELSGPVRLTNGDEELKLKGGGRYRISATTEGAGRGYSCDALIMDELRQQHNWVAWSALSKTTMARPKGQIFCISNAGDDQSVVLNSLRDSAMAQRDPSLGLFEWSAPDGCDMTDPEMWRMANPGLGYTVSEQAIRSALGTDPPNQFRTEVLCIRVKSLDGAIDEGAWAACADQSGTVRGPGRTLHACVDVSADGHHATMAVAARTPDGRFRVEIVRSWTSVEEARQDIQDLVVRNEFDSLSWFPSGPAAAIGFEVRNAAGRTNGIPGHFAEPVDLAGSEVTGLCQEFAILVSAGDVRHNDDPLLNSHVHGARKQQSGDAWRFRRVDAGHCDALYAAAGSVHVARRLSEGEYDISASIF